MKFLKTNQLKILLFLICIFAFILRIWQIDKNPPSLNWDEVSHGYNAYSILKTGRDEWGVLYPTIFRAFGDYKLPVYIYFVVASEAIFGLSELAVRLPSVLAGTFSVLLSFLLVKKLFKSEILAILAALLVAVEPWGLFLSRIAVEANVASFLIIAGICFFLLGLENGWGLLVSPILFGLSMFTYNSARVFAPLFFIVLLILYRRELFKKRKPWIFPTIAILAVFLTSSIIQVTLPEGQARYRWVSILDEGAVLQINELRGKSNWPEPLSRLFYNKLTYFSTKFAQNYINHFSPQFLFFKGGSHYQFNIPGKGLIYPIQIPFILLGCYLLLIQKEKTSSKIVLAWLFLAPIAGSLTKDSPHTLRAIVFLPVPQILTALGLWRAWSWGTIRIRKYRWLPVVLYFLILFFFLGTFWATYVSSYRTNYSWSWQYGYKEIVEFLKQNYDDYDKIIITKKYGEPHEFLLFWWPWDPSSYHQDPNKKWDYHANWYWVDVFDKFVFVNDWEVMEKLKNSKTQKLKELLVTSPGNYPEGWSEIKTINFLDGNPAFEILERK